MKVSSTLLVCALAMPLAAQEIETPTLGLQVRGSIPQAGLAEVVGDSGLSLPGLGASLVIEVDLEEGYRARVVMGGDRWDTGDWIGRPGIEGQVSDFHLGVEGVWMLRSDESPSWGPYLVAGLAGYAWSVGSRDTATGVTSTRRILHVAGTFGIGLRLARSLDVELRGLGGRIDPDLFAAAIQLGVTYRF